MSDSDRFKFVQSLAADLNGKQLRLPSLPDVVSRTRKALDHPDTTAKDLARILSVDSVLACRILVLANSTYYNPGGIRIEGLDPAVGRIGFEKVRTAAISYAVEQLYAAESLKDLKVELRQNWSRGIRRAAMAEVIARECAPVDSDSAFIAGLLHRIGDLYIFTKHKEYPDLLGDPKSRQEMIRKWSAPIGESIAANWDFSSEIQASINPPENEPARRPAKASLADVVITAKRQLNGGGDGLYASPEARRLGLTEDKMPEIVESYERRLESLASAVR